MDKFKSNLCNFVLKSKSKSWQYWDFEMKGCQGYENKNKKYEITESAKKKFHVGCQG